MTTNSKQSADARTDGPLHHLTIYVQGHVPHWKTFGPGAAKVEFTTHDNAGWISMDTTEWTEDHKSSKRTMLTLDEASGRQLFERLKAMYEPAPVAAQ
jgi:hypothetical protein